MWSIIMIRQVPIFEDCASLTNVWPKPVAFGVGSEWNFSCCRETLPSSGLKGPAPSESELLSNLGREGKGVPSDLGPFPSGLSATGWGKPWRKELHPTPLSWTLRTYQRLWEVPQKKRCFTQDYSVLFQAQMVKNLPTVQETGFDPQIGKIPWRRECHPLQYSGLENPMDRGAWQARVHGVPKSQTWQSDSLS